jgi:hypothetical protein
MRIPSLRFRSLGLTVFLVAPCICSAAPEEIQVYMEEFAVPGKFGLDFHTNYVLSAQEGSVNRNMLRVTPELSYGINENIELGVYWLTSTAPGQGAGHPVTDGAKLRLKYRPRPPTEGSPWYGAVNFELGKLSNRFYADSTSAEIKFIGVYRSEPWLFGVNFNVDRSLHRQAQQPTSTELDTKVSYRVSTEKDKELRIGIENYTYLGPLRRSELPSNRTTSTFLVGDFSLGKWDLNVGVGKSFGVTQDKLVVKAIVGVPLE